MVEGGATATRHRVNSWSLHQLTPSMTLFKSMNAVLEDAGFSSDSIEAYAHYRSPCPEDLTDGKWLVQCVFNRD